MDTIEFMNVIVSVLSGLAVCIPLVIQLTKYIKALVQEKNWNTLLKFVIELMEDAEEMFDDGASRKEWVLHMITSSSTYINYNIDIEVVSKMIDDLCSMTKVVNPPSRENETVSK